MTVDELQVLITANTNELRKEIGNANKSIAGLQKSANKGTAGVTSAFKKLKTGIIALGIGKLIKDSIQSGMDAVESDSLFETSLGASADAVRSWSDEVSSVLGLSAVDIRKNTGVIYNMTSSMGVAEDNALKMSKGISLLSQDMASFYNLDSTEAFNKLRAGLTGEAEGLKALGILVDENTVKQVAYSEGIATVGSELTQQEKVLARYVAILKQTGNAQGDLARTINSPSNQLRTLKQQVKDLGIAFSNFLLPVISAVLPYLTAFARVVTEALSSLARFLGLTGGGGASTETEKISDNVGGLAGDYDKATKSAKKLKNTMAGFDEMNVLQDNSSAGAGVGSASSTTVGLDFDLSEYDAKLKLVNSKTDKIVKNIKNAFAGVGDFLKGIWGNVWNSAPIQAFVGATQSYGQFLWDYWSQLGTTLYENITMTWGNISGNVSEYLSNMSTFWTLFWEDIQVGIDTWGQPIIDGVSGVFNSIWSTAIDPTLQLITQAWADTSSSLVSVWDEHGGVLIDNIGRFVDTTIGLFQSLYDNIIAPIIEPFLNMLKDLWDNHLKYLVEKVGNFVMKLINFALEIYNGFIAPIVNFLLETFGPVFEKVFGAIANVFGTVFGVISDVLGGIFDALGGLIDFISGVFSGNWQKAWDGIKAIFSGIWDALWGIVKGIGNLIIDGINMLWTGIYKAIKGIVDAVGSVAGLIGDLFGQDWHFSMPPDPPLIPRLARGGIVNSPTVAMIGEAGKEAVMPLENNTGWIDQLAQKIGDKLGGATGNISLVVKLGEEAIFDRFIEYGKEKAFETNGEVVFA